MDEVEEELSKAKHKVDWSLYVYHFDYNDSNYSFLHDYTKEFLEKSQKHIMEIKEMIKENEKITSEQNVQLEEKEEEIEKLKNEISQAKEEKKEDYELRRNLADLKELTESNVNLKTQLEEAKRREEVVRNQLNKRE
jgi:predicted RNase H-like nuclease (RuvC/YqgF family)